MLSLKNRLKKEKDFQRVFSHGRMAASDLMSIRFLNNDIQETRVGFIVSKKVSKKAVLRNRIKRVLREQMKKRMDKIIKGFDIIITAKGKILELESEEIGESLEKLLKRTETLIK